MGFQCAASSLWPTGRHALDVRVATAGITLVNAVGNLGGFVGPTVLGHFQQATGSTATGLHGLSAVSVLATASIPLLRRRARRGLEERALPDPAGG